MVVFHLLKFIQPRAIQPFQNRAFLSSKSSESFHEWNNFKKIAKTVQKITEESGKGKRMPNTQDITAYCEEGKEIVTAIRQKHGGFATVAKRLGLVLGTKKPEKGKRLQRRRDRRESRLIKLKQLHLLSDE